MWLLLILVLLQVEVSVLTARDVGRGMCCQRPHSGSLAGEFPWAEGPAVGPAPCTGAGGGCHAQCCVCTCSRRALDG